MKMCSIWLIVLGSWFPLYRYSSAGHSLLEPLMQCYWEWLVGHVPTWIAPNLITIVGLATNVFTTLVLVYYCPTATEQVTMATM